MVSLGMGNIFWKFFILWHQACLLGMVYERPRYGLEEVLVIFIWFLCHDGPTFWSWSNAATAKVGLVWQVWHSDWSRQLYSIGGGGINEVDTTTSKGGMSNWRQIVEQTWLFKCSNRSKHSYKSSCSRSYDTTQTNWNLYDYVRNWENT